VALSAKDIMGRFVSFSSVSRDRTRDAGNWGGAIPASQVEPFHLMNAASGQDQEAQYSSVICGPGDIAQAHQADEFISVEQFRAGGAFMSRLVDHLSE